MESFEPFAPKTGLTDKISAQRTEASGYAEEIHDHERRHGHTCNERGYKGG